MVLKRISDFSRAWSSGIQQSCMWRADRHPRGDFRSWTDRADVRSAEVTGRPHGRIRVKSWQAHSDLTILSGYAPQESGPSEHRGSSHKRVAKLPRRTSIIFGDFNGDPMPDDAATGWQRPCETLTDNGAHISEICVAAQFWSRATWSANPSRLDSSTSDN